LFLEYLLYSDEDRKNIEEDTRGQHKNRNWFGMRKGLITASVVKKVISSTDLKNTASKLLQPSDICDDNLPAAMKFGRDHEKRALQLFTRLHRFRHRQCSATVPGLIVSGEDSYLAASPDAIFDCHHCGRFVVEIKCLYSKRKYHPRAAIKASGFCELHGETFKLKNNHSYYCQLQCQMAVTGLKTGVLVVYTDRGVEPVHVEFDEDWWKAKQSVLKDFYLTSFLPLWKVNTCTAYATECVANDVSDSVVDNAPVTADCVANDVSDSVVDNAPVTADCVANDVSDSASRVVDNAPVTAPVLATGSDMEDGSSVLNTVPQSPGRSSELSKILSASIATEHAHMAHVHSHMADFTSYLHSRNFTLHDTTPNDGNCFFGAVSSQLCRTGQENLSPASIREMLCDYLTQLSMNEQIVLEQFMEGRTFGEYVINMRKNGTYADNIVVEWTSRMLGQSITVIDVSNDLVFGNPVSDKILYIGYIAQLQHYVSVKPQ
jgi:hypothetical protein